MKQLHLVFAFVEMVEQPPQADFEDKHKSSLIKVTEKMMMN